MRFFEQLTRIRRTIIENLIIYSIIALGIILFPIMVIYDLCEKVFRWFRRLFLSAAEIKDFRLVLGLTQEKFAELLEVDPTTVQRWEYGWQRPRGRNLFMLRQLMDRERKRLLKSLDY